jgi:hypothetical protein
LSALDIEPPDFTFLDIPENSLKEAEEQDAATQGMEGDASADEEGSAKPPPSSSDKENEGAEEASG